MGIKSKFSSKNTGSKGNFVSTQSGSKSFCAFYPPPIPTFIFQVETSTSGLGDICIVGKRNYATFVEVANLAVGDVVIPGVYKTPDLTYGSSFGIVACPTYDAVGAVNDIIIKKFQSSLSVDWTATIQVNHAYYPQQFLRLAVNWANSVGYVSYGGSPSNLTRWLI